MIKVDVLLTPLTKQVYGIILKGHAKSDEYGKDLVCAAVSAIVTGGANAMMEFSEDICSIQLESGNSKIISQLVGNSIPTNDELILKIIVTQLETVAESYGEFIQINKIVKEKV